MLKAKLLAGGGAETIYVDDVFSAYTYTGNGSTQTITNGIDLSTNGGMVWGKSRSQAYPHYISDTARGAGNFLLSESTSANYADATILTSFNSNGFTLGSKFSLNESPQTFVGWTFRKAPKFFSQATATVTGGADATVSFSDLATLGMVAVKRTDSTGSWYVWHRSLTAGKLLYLEQTAAEATLGHITVSGTTVTLEGGVIANGDYIVYAWAHDTATDGLIQCGSFTAGSGVTTTVNLGWEPQYILVKSSSSAGDWRILDTMRGIPTGTVGAADDLVLKANTSDSEATLGIANVTSTGFEVNYGGGSVTYIYLAIRRPNKPPTVGTQVYNAIARTGTGAAATVTGVGFAPDLVHGQMRSSSAGAPLFSDRLRGTSSQLLTNNIIGEQARTDCITGFGMDGISVGVDAGGFGLNTNTITHVAHFFKRAPGVFDQVCYTGTGVAKTEAHGLGVVPELMIVKSRSAAGHWAVYNSFEGATEYTFLNTTDASAGPVSSVWNNTAPTTSVFTVGTSSAVNTAVVTYVAYLFATKAGISKVGSYTGTATTNAIDCGFTTGARFILIKRVDSTGDWYVWDTVRGIIAGNDPYVLLNSTAAETTSTDYIDSYTSGFELSSTAPAAINASGGTYIYLAFA